MDETSKIVTNDELARVDWQMGQTLLPDHLIAQEESILANLKQRFRFMGLPLYGIGKLELRESLLNEGIFSIVSLSLVLPSGVLVDIPGNTQAQPFNMNVTGLTKVPIYFHLLGNRNANEEDDEEKVTRRKYVAEISSSQGADNSLQNFKIAELIKDAEGTWSFSDNYIPPLLQVGTSPFLMSMINYLAQLLEVFHFKLEREIAARHLSGENLFSAKQCLQGVYRIQSFIANLRTQVHYHPYFLYEALKTFYVDLCLYQSFTPENVESPYLHDQLAECLKKISDPLMKQMQLMKGKSPYIPFKRQDGLFSIQQLPKEARLAKEVYLLIQKKHVSETFDADSLKLASVSRISAVHQLSLRGVPFKSIPRPPFQHSFGAEVDFFQIEPGEEWDHVLSEGAAAFYDKPEYEGMNAYLYWREN